MVRIGLAVFSFEVAFSSELEAATSGQVVALNSEAVACANCYHSDWAAPWSCAANAQACWNSGGAWYGQLALDTEGTPSGQVTLKSGAVAAACANCYHSDWAVPWSCAASAQACWNSGGAWYGQLALDNAATSSDVALRLEAAAAACANCYHSDWAAPWSCAASAQACWNSGGAWYGQLALETDTVASGQVALKSDAAAAACANCYHSDWAAPWSCAANAQACWNSGGAWYGQLALDTEGTASGQVTLKLGVAAACANCYHSDWAVPWSCAASAQACWNSGGAWYGQLALDNTASSDEVALRSEAMAAACANCYHSDWAVPWSCAASAQACWNSGGAWYGQLALETDVATSGQVALKSEVAAAACANCYHSDWAAPWSCAASAQACWNSGGAWYGQLALDTEGTTSGQVTLKSGAVAAACANCYHSDWAVPWSCAASAQACWNSGGAWYGQLALDNTASSDEVALRSEAMAAACANCYHSDWAAPWSCAASAQACWNSGGAWYGQLALDTDVATSGQVALKSEAAAAACANCYHSDWAAPWSCAADAQACWNSGGAWYGQLALDTECTTSGQVTLKSGAVAAACANCYHSDWAVPWSCAANAEACWNSGGAWYGQLALDAGAAISHEATEVALRSEAAIAACANCYHSDWAAPWSCAASAQACWNSGGAWYGQLASKPEHIMV